MKTKSSTGPFEYRLQPLPTSAPIPRTTNAYTPGMGSYIPPPMPSVTPTERTVTLKTELDNLNARRTHSVK